MKTSSWLLTDSEVRKRGGALLEIAVTTELSSTTMAQNLIMLQEVLEEY